MARVHQELSVVALDAVVRIRKAWCHIQILRTIIHKVIKSRETFEIRIIVLRK